MFENRVENAKPPGTDPVTIRTSIAQPGFYFTLGFEIKEDAPPDLYLFDRFGGIEGAAWARTTIEGINVKTLEKIIYFLNMCKACMEETERNK